MVYIVSGDVYSCGSIAFGLAMSGMSFPSLRYRIPKGLIKGPAFCLVKRARMVFRHECLKTEPFLKLSEQYLFLLFKPYPAILSIVVTTYFKV